MSLAKPRCIRLTDLAYGIAIDHAAQRGFESVAAYIEWVLLSQQYPQDKVAEMFGERRRQGQR